MKVGKLFECKSRCDFLKIEGITFTCDKCIKHLNIKLTTKQKEKILVILNEK